MCGICGIFGYGDKIAIEKMLETLRHRGPDDKGVFVDDSISLGHARLSIIDLSPRGHQPMSNEEGDIWLSVNGEIYNHITLRAELQAKGHMFHSNSDSEVIIHAYEEYGLDFVQFLRGMYAFALYDSSKKILILGRDPIGKKPLYYFYDNNVLFFASEIKAILELGVGREINYDAVWGYLAYQYSVGVDTLFKGVKKVLPGNIMIISNEGIRSIEYWNIKEKLTYDDHNTSIKKLRSLLEESTKLRMVADVPIGAFLSGGLDSSAVAALGRKYSDDVFHTYSVGFETFSELEYAEIVSQHLDTTHHEIIITDKMVLQDLNKIAWHYDEPLGDAAIINNFILSREARKDVKVVLAGEGGDELFGGYQNYYQNLKMIRMFNPESLSSIGSFLNNPYFSLQKHFVKPNKIDNIIRYAKYFCGKSIEEFHHNTTRVLSDDNISDLTSLDNPKINLKVNYPDQIKNSLNKMLVMDCKNLLPDKFLMKADKGTMANSIEERLPLLDINIIDFAFSLSSELKINNGSVKYILKESVKDLIPNRIINRKKVGFGTTTGHWMQNELREVVEQKICEGRLLKRILRSEKHKELSQNIDKAISTNSAIIWTLFALEVWHGVYFGE